MANGELRRISIPLGATIRVTRTDGSEQIYIFRGSDQQGAIYEDENGQRHSDIGIYRELAVKDQNGWQPV
jgi:hypothetical protein